MQYVGEKILFVAGLTLAVGIIIVASGGSFGMWTISKVFYGIGVILFVFDK